MILSSVNMFEFLSKPHLHFITTEPTKPGLEKPNPSLNHPSLLGPCVVVIGPI